MFARRNLLNIFEDFWHLKVKVCEPCGINAGKCASSAVKVGECRARCCHWYTGPTAPSFRNRTAKFNVAKIMEPSTVNNAKDLSVDQLTPNDMELGTDNSDSDDGVMRIEEPVFSRRRHLEFSPYGAALCQSRDYQTGTLKKNLLSVATYNVLSQSLLEMHSYLYPNSHKKDLKWAVRKGRLLRDFEFLNPDVLCLQEVEAQHLDFFNSELNLLGYTGIYKKRTHDKVDGEAIYFKKDKFNLMEHRQVELFRDRVKLLDRDNVGLIAKLSFKSDSSRQVVIATTHLLYTIRRTDIRLTQTQMMLAEIEKMAYKGDDAYWPIVYMGDMNYTPDSPVYELVTRGYMQYHGRGIIRGGGAATKTLLPKSVGVTDSCQFSQLLKERCEDYKMPLHGSGALDHRLNLTSVYSHVKNWMPEASTYQDQWHTVDYIFYSQNGRTNGPHSYELRPVSRLGLPSSEECEVELGHIPNRSCGSDHLPLLATFHFADAGSSDFM